MSGQGKFKLVINKPACCASGGCAETCPKAIKPDRDEFFNLDNEI